MSAADIQSQNVEVSQNNIDLHLETQNLTQSSADTTQQPSNLTKTKDLVEQDMETKVNGELAKRLVDYDQISDDESGKPASADKLSVQKDGHSNAEATAENTVLAKDTTPSEEIMTDGKETEKSSSPVKKSALRRRKASSSPERDNPSEPKRAAMANKKTTKGTAGSDTAATVVEETTTTTTDDEKPTDSPRRTRERRKQESESSDTSSKRTLRSADHPSSEVRKKSEAEKPSAKKLKDKTVSSSDTSTSKQASSAKKPASDVKRAKSTSSSGDNAATSVKSKPSRTPSAASPSRASPSRATAASGRSISKKSGGGKKTGGRVYDSDDFQDEETAAGEKSPAPLKHVHAARGAFGDMKFTKAAADESPKYVSLAKSAEKRRQKSNKSPGSSATPTSSGKSDTQASGSVKKAKTFTTEQLKRKSLKSSLSPGEMADVSSYDTKSSAPSTGGPRDSIGGVVDNPTASPKRPAPESSDSKKKHPPPSGGGSGKKSTQGSPMLFGDVSQKICVDFDDVHFLTDGSKSSTTTTPTVKKGRPAGSSAKRKTPSSKSATSTEERRREPKREEKYSRSPPPMDFSPQQPRKKRPVEKLTPKPKKPHLEKLTPEQQLERDVASQSSHHLQPGCRALCRWADRCFYPAYVVEDIGFGRYTVRFVEDRQYSNIPFPEIIPIVNLKPGNTLMMKPKDSRNEYILTPIKIISLPSITSSEEWFQGLFEVENTQTQEISKASWERLFIDADQTKDYISRAAMVNKAAQEVVEDNISDTRIRRNRGKRSQAFEEEPEEEEEETTEAAVSVPAPKRSVSKTPRPKSVTPRQKPHGAGHAPRAMKKMKAAELEYSDMQGVINEDTDEERLSIFDDMVFVLTSANRARPRDGSDSLEEERPLIPFNKKQVRQMIDELGGKVIDDFMILSSTQSCFLVADQYYRTHKYLSALARAVPCVSHMWIHDCCQAGQLLQHNNYMLPAGQSLETNQIIEWHNKCPQLLANKKIFVYTENRPTNPGALDFVQIWAPLVKCMGAHLLESLPQAEDDDSHVDILLTDISCPNSVLAQATSLGANAVSSEWLIQAIITGRTPEPKGHLKYRYDYVEKPDTQQ